MADCPGGMGARCILEGRSTTRLSVRAPVTPRFNRFQASLMPQVQAHGRTTRSGWAHASVGALLLGAVSAASAAAVDPAEFDHLMNEARTKGVVSVLVQLEDAVPLQAIRDQTPAKRAESVARAGRLRAELGGHALDAGHWSNGLGQASFYVTPTGLEMLRANPRALTVSRDVAAAQRIVVNTLDGSLDEVEAALQQRGRVEVDVVLNVHSADYEIDAEAQTRFRPRPQLPAQAAAAVKALMAEPFAKGIHGVDSSLVNGKGAAPKLRMSVDLEAFLGLKEHLGIRAIRLAGHKDRRKAEWDQEALATAQREGSAEVAISLRGSESFSPRSGYMSAQAWAAQEAAHRKAFAEILSAAGAAKALDDVKNGIGLGTIGVRLNQAALERLFQLSDPRVLAVQLNRPVAAPLLNQAMGLINASAAWNAGYRANGQTIVMLDSGILKSHDMFKVPAFGGLSKVTREGCFGSNSGAYFSICPSQNAKFDSPLFLRDSGLPPNMAACSATANCNHGTKAAAIAAGTKTPSVPLQGFAIGANLMSIQVFSWTQSAGADAFRDDVQAALEAVRSLTLTGTNNNPYVVNMSLGGGAYLENCDSAYPGVTSAVHDLLSRGVPVVAAAGNDGPAHKLAWPACISGVTKVSGVRNDTRPELPPTDPKYLPPTDAKWNYGDPSKFTGPIFLAPAGSSDLTYANYSVVETAGIAHNTQIVGAVGTSFAAPQISGVYAALKAAKPGISVAEATNWIASGCGSFALQKALPPPPYGPGGTATYRRLSLNLSCPVR